MTDDVAARPREAVKPLSKEELANLANQPNAYALTNARVLATLSERDAQIAVIARDIFPAIEHGDEKHRAWLKEKLAEFFANAISAEAGDTP